jgi:hypothetical protein
MRRRICRQALHKTGHDLMRSLSSTPGHVIGAVSGFAVFMSMAARDILRLHAGRDILLN